MADVKVSALTAASAAAKSMLIPVVQDPSGTPASRKLTVLQLFDLDDGVKTSSAPLINMAQTWNNSGVTFTALKFNIAATAAASDSLLIDLQVGGSSKFSVRVDGAILNTPGITLANGQAWGTNLSLNSATLLAWNADTYLARDGANIVALRNGTSANTIRIYNTYTDASNYERGNLTWSSTANYLMLETKAQGTGSARPIWINAQDRLYFTAGGGATAQWQINTSGHFLANTDNTYDIGASGATRPRTGYFGTSIISPIATLATGTITTSQPALSVTQTWNAGGVTFVSDTQDVTNTASAAGSLLIERKVGGTALFQVRKDGSVFLNNAAASTSVGGVGVHGQTGGSLHFGAINGNAYIGKSNDFGATALIGIANGGVTVRSDGNFSFSSDTTSFGTRDLLLVRDAANTLAQRNGTNAQTLRVYGTYTDSSNYERIEASYAGGAFYLSVGKSGTGGNRPFIINNATTERIDFYTANTVRWSVAATGHFLATTDNTYDIGASGATRPRNGYFAGTVFSASGFEAPAGGNGYKFAGRGFIIAQADGVFSLSNSSDNSFNRLQFGGTTSSFPAIKRDSAAIKFVLGDDSASAAVEALSYTSGAPNTGTAAAWKFGSLITAAVTPDTTRYIELDVAGTLYKVIVST